MCTHFGVYFKFFVSSTASAPLQGSRLKDDCPGRAHTREVGSPGNLIFLKLCFDGKETFVYSHSMGTS